MLKKIARALVIATLVGIQIGAIWSEAHDTPRPTVAFDFGLLGVE